MMYQFCINRLLYDLCLVIGGKFKVGIGNKEIYLSLDTTSTHTWKDLYVYLICHCDWLFKVQKEPIQPTISLTMLEELQTFKFDRSAKDFECLILMNEYAKYRVQDNIHYLLSDYFCFDHVGLFLSIIPLRSTKAWVNVHNVEEFQTEALKLLNQYSGTEDKISFDDLLEIMSLNKRQDHLIYLNRGYTKPILNSLLLLCSNMYQKVQYKKLVVRHLDYNRHSVQSVTAKKTATTRKKSSNPTPPKKSKV